MEESTPLIQRRAVERIPANIGIRFFFGNIFYSGIVTDISGQGMFIRSLITPPAGSLFPIIIQKAGKVFVEHVRVKHLTKTNNDISGMGVKIIGPSQGYLELANKVF